MADIAVVDTHALIWATTGHKRKLGKKARAFLERVEAGRASLYVPTLVLVEYAEAVHNGRIQLDGSFTSWMRALLRTNRYHSVDLTPAILESAEELYAIPERGDRLICATAVVCQSPLITRDPEITKVAAVDHIW